MDNYQRHYNKAIDDYYLTLPDIRLRDARTLVQVLARAEGVAHEDRLALIAWTEELRKHMRYAHDFCRDVALKECIADQYRTNVTSQLTTNEGE
jgi:hypothetical protein